MKQKTNLEVSPFYSETTGKLNREQTLTIDTFELEPERKTKPKPDILKQMRYIKKRRKEGKYSPIDNPYRTFELSISEVLQAKKRGVGRVNQIQEIISLLAELQRNRGILDMNRNFINKILEDYTNLESRTKQRWVNQIINKSKSSKERAIKNKFLTNVCNYEVKFKGELTTSPKKPLNREWITKQNIETFYSFL